MNVSAPPQPASTGLSRPIRAMIVDDALVARGFVKRWVDAEPDLELVGSLRDGREAIEKLEKINPDVVVLDVEMPDIDGIIAQDEETSVVWGMPGSVAEAGLCSAILPLNDIAPKIVRIFAGERQ